MQGAKRPVCVVLGVGPGNGAAIARRFARSGALVALMARNAGRLSELAASIDGSVAIPCDMCDPSSIHAAFSQIHSSLGGRRYARL